MSHPQEGPEATLARRRNHDFSDELDTTGWYHGIELPSGVVHGKGKLSPSPSKVIEGQEAENLAGALPLDIGTWDGWFAFEAERRGADVVAVDIAPQENFYQAHRELKSNVRYEVVRDLQTARTSDRYLRLHAVPRRAIPPAAPIASS